ncbi:type II toxin-antitoxin system RelE/ParE family toxin [Candidatus Venteria ishoeyi]|uniref:type II toxin-antitoxin system RelE family toxin n=1 Tax=Candidatus Venteria ishoeyi TaxID=1899563 RepID=UPI0025A5BD1E|nr:type II toxin-antitoxin system RelE/ParE family toxin [Candidatus Venteria ishoeyi]MDM8545020.1 type II toxin-antitoxin system RelE/ParE family toxin [Candidatus Venteria ishoeyi]
MYKAYFSKQTKKFLAKCDKSIFERFEQQLVMLIQDPYSQSLDIKKLKNHTCYRLRIGKYRFLYEVREQELIIFFVKADSRGGVY